MLEESKLHSCPCCGYRTLTIRGEYDICRVCWWEDDGQDNETADKKIGGPNGMVSLTRARYNFIKFGIFDPARKDLHKIKDSKEDYEMGRMFVLDEDGTISEPINNWRSKLI